MGWYIISPFDVYLDDEANAIQPDLCIILEGNPSTVDLKTPFRGIPDLIVEILSSGNKDFDLLKKKGLYEKFGVREYWILDPETRLGLVYSLKDNHFVKISEAIGKVKSSLLDASLVLVNSQSQRAGFSASSISPNHTMPYSL